MTLIQTPLTLHPSDVLYWILGRYIERLDFEEMLNFWLISGNTVNSIYKEAVKGRSGND